MNIDDSQPHIASKNEAQVVYQNQLGFVVFGFVMINVSPYKHRWYIYPCYSDLLHSLARRPCEVIISNTYTKGIIRLPYSCFGVNEATLKDMSKINLFQTTTE